MRNLRFLFYVIKYDITYELRKNFSYSKFFLNLNSNIILSGWILLNILIFLTSLFFVKYTIYLDSPYYYFSLLLSEVFVLGFGTLGTMSMEKQNLYNYFYNINHKITWFRYFLFKNSFSHSLILGVNMGVALNINIYCIFLVPIHFLSSIYLNSQLVKFFIKNKINSRSNFFPWLLISIAQLLIFLSLICIIFLNFNNSIPHICIVVGDILVISIINYFIFKNPKESWNKLLLYFGDIYNNTKIATTFTLPLDKSLFWITLSYTINSILYNNFSNYIIRVIFGYILTVTSVMTTAYIFFLSRVDEKYIYIIFIFGVYGIISTLSSRLIISSIGTTIYFLNTVQVFQKFIKSFILLMISSCIPYFTIIFIFLEIMTNFNAIYIVIILFLFSLLASYLIILSDYIFPCFSENNDWKLPTFLSNLTSSTIFSIVVYLCVIKIEINFFILFIYSIAMLLGYILIIILLPKNKIFLGDRK